MINWQESVVLITGGTGSFGRKLTEIILREYHPKKLVIFSRDELKQHGMHLSGFDQPSLRYFIGNVRDRHRLQIAMNREISVRCAALVIPIR
jgi:UDP-N-acetylglucosamine 4,6-dehydratase